MFQIKQLDRLTDSIPSSFEIIYTNSFPADERRNATDLAQIHQNKANCTFNLIVYDRIEIGLLVSWEFDDFYYLEHFAIAKTYRNRGYGKKALNLWLSNRLKPVVLEVEPPTNEESKRRIRFYEELGLKFWNVNYIQPPYSPDKKSVHLKLMSFGDLDIEKSYEQIKRVLHKEVYGVVAK
ncbi:MAG: GNAT family N-acetyltransferase [Bacteroidales bacterium]|nr:GNAT family N-acetyltransferase [Bacteroidales bacterium]